MTPHLNTITLSPEIVLVSPAQFQSVKFLESAVHGLTPSGYDCIYPFYDMVLVHGDILETIDTSEDLTINCVSGKLLTVKVSSNHGHILVQIW